MQPEHCKVFHTRTAPEKQCVQSFPLSHYSERLITVTNERKL